MSDHAGGPWSSGDAEVAAAAVEVRVAGGTGGSEAVLTASSLSLDDLS